MYFRKVSFFSTCPVIGLWDVSRYRPMESALLRAYRIIRYVVRGFHTHVTNLCRRFQSAVVNCGRHACHQTVRSAAPVRTVTRSVWPGYVAVRPATSRKTRPAVCNGASSILTNFILLKNRVQIKPRIDFHTVNKLVQGQTWGGG